MATRRITLFGVLITLLIGTLESPRSLSHGAWGPKPGPKPCWGL